MSNFNNSSHKEKTLNNINTIKTWKLDRRKTSSLINCCKMVNKFFFLSILLA